VRQMMKTYLAVILIGLVVAGICFCMCPTGTHAEPLARLVRPERPDAKVEPEYVMPSRMKTLSGWETSKFSPSEMRTKVEAAADALHYAQNTSTKGWAFDLDIGGASAANIYGVVGLGLLRAYNLTKTRTGTTVTADKGDYLTAAGETANAIADAILADSFPLQATDYIFLYYYAQVSGDSSYYMDANGDLQADIIGSHGSDPNLVAIWLDDIDEDDDQGKLWQLANWVEVFQLYGETDYADAVVGKIMNRYVPVGTGANKVCGFVYDTDVKYVRTLDQARVVEVLKRFYGTVYPTIISEGLALLKDLQYNNGYVRWGCQLNTGTGNVTLFPSVMVQDQACAVKAMAYTNQTTLVNYDELYGTFWAANALMEMEDTAGGFTTDSIPEGIQTRNISEYNAEALDALHASCGEGDVDRDGQVMPWDALDALRAAVGMPVGLNGPTLLAADRNGDNVISAADALAILRAVVGKVIEVKPGDNLH